MASSQTISLRLWNHSWELGPSAATEVVGATSPSRQSLFGKLRFRPGDLWTTVRQQPELQGKRLELRRQDENKNSLGMRKMYPNSGEGAGSSHLWVSMWMA